MKGFSSYIVREIIPLYVSGLAALVLLLLGVTLLGVLADVISRGISPTLVAEYLLYSLPAAASRGLPLALLFASLLGLARLGQDSEIKAGLLLGLSPAQFATPMIALGVLVSGLSFVNGEVVVPWSAARALEVQKDILIQSPESIIQAGQFFTDALGRSVYIESLSPGGVVEGITVIQSGASRGPDEVIQASRGVLDEAAGVWRLEEVRMVSYRQSRVVLEAFAETGEVPVRGLAAGLEEPPELTQIPMRDLVQRLRSGVGARGMPAEWTALHRKFAEPLAATAFALFALAISLYSFRNNVGLGLVAVLFLTFIYYATWSIFNVLGAQGTVPAWLAAWVPVALYAVSGTVLLGLAWRR